MTNTPDESVKRSPAAPVMRPARKTGIVGYGAYIPRYRLPGKEVSRVWTEGNTPPPVAEKSVPGLDEDVVTMSIEAARNALARAGIDPAGIGAVWVGSESHPYAVKPTSTIVGEAIGAAPHMLAADWEFACKAGSEAMQAAVGMVGSGMIRYAMAIGMDAAQGRPGDALEYTAGAGGAAFLIGPAEESLAAIEASYSFATDTPDFWRRDQAMYPSHGQRFTGEPAYFHHVAGAGRALLEATGTSAEDYRFAVFHQPNPKFPQRAAQMLGFTKEQIQPGLLAPQIGNTYSGSALIGLAAVLDQAAPGDRIFVVSFGSGAGSDAFQITATERLPGRKANAPRTADYIARRKEIDYGVYVRYRGKLKM
jgi:hydroxymethylglutaryl-CoA synthase